MRPGDAADNDDTMAQRRGDSPPGQRRLLRAPAVPAFFELKQGDAALLTGAAHFADPRESDLTEAGARDEVTGLRVDLGESHSESDGQWRLWTLLLLLAWLASRWYIREAANSRKAAALEKPAGAN